MKVLPFRQNLLLYVQFKYLLARQFSMQCRARTVLLFRGVQALSVSLLLGLFFLGLNPHEQGILESKTKDQTRSRIALIFFISLFVGSFIPVPIAFSVFLIAHQRHYH